MFKTARWNNWDKVWEIKDSKISSNKLEKWILEVSDIVEEIESIKENISSVNETTVKSKKLNKKIKEAQSEIEALKVELAEAQVKKESEEKDIKAFVDSLIDTSRLESISSTVSDYARKFFC